MRQYLLDSGPLTSYLRGRPAVVERLSPWVMGQAAATSVVSYGEVVEYLAGFSDFPRHRDHLRRLLRSVRPLTLTYRVMERYADLRRALRPPHGPGSIGDIDTLIAATALVHDLMLVTMDGDFRRVPELRLLLLPRP